MRNAIYSDRPSYPEVTGTVKLIQEEFDALKQVDPLHRKNTSPVYWR